jgi:hypothetical protein
MVRMKYFTLLASAIAAFVASSVWYSPLLFGKQFMELSGVGPTAGPNIVKIVGELGRNLILAYVLGRFVVLLEIVEWKGALNLGVWLWIGFPVLLLSGSVMWQKVPRMLAAIHAGDWLVEDTAHCRDTRRVAQVRSGAATRLRERNRVWSGNLRPEYQTWQRTRLKRSR